MLIVCGVKAKPGQPFIMNITKPQNKLFTYVSSVCVSMLCLVCAGISAQNSKVRENTSLGH